MREQIENEARAAHAAVPALSDDAVDAALAQAAALVHERRNVLLRANEADLDAAVDLDAGTRDRLRLDVDAVLRIVDEAELLDRQPVIQRSVRLRNPYVDPMNAIQVELLRRYRAAEDDEERERLRPPLVRSIAGIAAALRNTG